MVFRGAAALSVLFLCGAGGLPAVARADTGYNPPEQVYAGPVLGYDNVVASDIGYSVNRGGLTYGGLAGIDTPVGLHGRVGAEVEVTGSTTAFTTVSGADTLKLSSGVDAFVGGKLGWMLTPKLQAFSRIGYAYSRFTLSQSTNGIKVAQSAFNLSGFRVGAGAEYLLTRNVRARVEYDYTHYGEVHADGQDLGFKLERHEVTAGLLYGF